jgi:hypothetical protein
MGEAISGEVLYPVVQLMRPACPAPSLPYREIPDFRRMVECNHSNIEGRRARRYFTAALDSCVPSEFDCVRGHPGSPNSEALAMNAKIAEILINLSKIAARASVEDQPLVASLARETLAMAEVLQKIANGSSTLNSPPTKS